jgi:LacI family transcriptional regulator
MAVIPFFTTFFFMEILQGVQSKLSELECDLLLFGVNHPDQLEDSMRHHILRNRVDGILFFSMRMPEIFVKQFIHHQTPVVLVDSYHKRFDSLDVDNQQGAYVATNHLIASGHRRIGMLNGNLESVPARERLRGFRKAMEDAQLHIDPSLLKNTVSPRLDGFTREAGYEVMQEFLKLGKKMPSAIFVSSDIQAAGALAAIAESGMKCPDDISIVGFDDIELASHLGLTTMRQPMFEMGKLAAEVLLARLGQAKREPVHTMFVPKLIIRKTTEGLDSRIRVASESAA